MSSRITHNPQQCGGRPCIRGMQIRVQDILEIYAAGQSSQQNLVDFPDLEAEDLQAPWPMPHGRSTTTSWWDEALAAAQLPPLLAGIDQCSSVMRLPFLRQTA